MGLPVVYTLGVCPPGGQATTRMRKTSLQQCHHVAGAKATALGGVSASFLSVPGVWRQD